LKLAKVFLILIVLNAVVIGSLFLLGVVTTEQATYVGLRVSGILGLLLIGSVMIGFLAGKETKQNQDSTKSGPQF
jgi:hypothetical protein